MKKYISILAVLLMLSLTACSNLGTTPTGTGNTSNTQSESITMLDEGVWPVNEYTEGLPVPSGTVAWAMLDTEHENCSISIVDIDESAYNEYMELLKQEGFSVIEDVSEETPKNKENLVVFLEKCYKNGFSGKKAAMIYRKLYDLAKKKAELLGTELVLADDYKNVAERNGFEKKRSYLYVSESKNGKQYLDSLGGNCESGGYYVRGNFFFAS